MAPEFLARRQAKIDPPTAFFYETHVEIEHGTDQRRDPEWEVALATDNLVRLHNMAWLAECRCSESYHFDPTNGRLLHRIDVRYITAWDYLYPRVGLGLTQQAMLKVGGRTV